MANQTTASRLSKDWFLSEDVPRLSKELLGKILVSSFDGERTAGRIVETEAYRAPDDKACHAHLNRFTKRTSVMFLEGGHAYIYLCYGIHHLFNIVTGPEGMAHAILIRAIEPLGSIEPMLRRRGFEQVRPQLTAGPGVLTKALGINKSYTGTDMTLPDSPFWIEDDGWKVSEEQILASPRVGIDYAEECIDWPWRFRIKGNRWTSKAK
ncbi:MAG: DNA-3-methyladenine glycosylase [Bacteroidota bacterium]